MATNDKNIGKGMNAAGGSLGTGPKTKSYCYTNEQGLTTYSITPPTVGPKIKGGKSTK